MEADAPGPSENQKDDGTHPADTSSPGDTAETSGQEEEDRVEVCQFFLLGKCRFGHRCRLSHSDPSADDSEAAPLDRDDKEDQEKLEKLTKKGNKSTKPKYEAKDVNKKPRMRTADDVISRILWDPSVDASEFVVGYVDRFLGVLERPFNEFNWDTSPCDCDYTSELALPRHRIQYFTHRGHRVWDRHSRTDRVFGSTGQSLAPPFGGEEEVKGANTEEQEDLEITDELPPAVCGQEGSETEQRVLTGNAHLARERPNDSAPLDTNRRENISQDPQESQGARVTEEAAIRCTASPVPMTSSLKQRAGINEEAEREQLSEWKESWEGSEDALSYQGALNLSQSPPALEQEVKPAPLKPGGRPPRKRPTHFITFRANTPAILSAFQQLQEEIVSLIPSSEPHWLPSSSLHVTMCLLNLPGPAEVAGACEVLRRFAHLDRNPPVALTFPVKLKHFNGKVLYLSPQPHLHLQQLNSGLQEAYRKKGWLHRDSYNPRYHLTLAKVVGTDVDRLFERVGDLKVGKGLNFGRLPINTLHLCTVGGFTVESFYPIKCTVTLR